MNNALSYEVEKIVQEVAIYLKEQQQSLSKQDIITKEHNSFVSFVDREAEERLVDGLSKVLPEAGFITEEGTVAQNNEKLHWVIDPLDGTTNYIHGLPIYSISIALMEGGEGLAGFVMDVCNDGYYSAEKNKGAYRNGKKIQVSQRQSLKESLLATGFPYQKFDRLDDYMKLLKQCMFETRGVRRLGSAAIDLIYVADGRFDLFYEYNLNAWDVAGGAVLVQEAGGKVVDFSNGNQFIQKKELIAANPYIIDEFLTWIQKYF